MMAPRQKRQGSFMEQICYIVGASNAEDLYIAPDQKHFIIAADGGLTYLEKQGISPDLTIGDFDSLGYVPQNGSILQHPPEKDDTDMVLAIREGQQRGYNTFVLYGGLGGRLDHTYANLQALCYLANCGAVGYLLGDGTAVTAIKQREIRFGAEENGMLSVFCAGSCARGITLQGFKYPLEHGVFTAEIPLGVSNEFLGIPSRIAVSDGTLLVMWTASPEHILHTLPVQPL
jgi:thiamine pyrophosphokinase